jgi:hypothetical protein
MISPSKLLKPFSESIHAKVKALHNLDLMPHQISRFKESISDDIRKCTDLITPQVSKAAAGEAARQGLNLRILGWHKQPKVDRGRRIFHYEHGVTVWELRRLCMRRRTARGVLRVLTTKPRVVWILKKEDRRLTALGLRSKRPDMETAYRKAGIVF